MIREGILPARACCPRDILPYSGSLGLLFLASCTEYGLDEKVKLTGCEKIATMFNIALLE